MQIQLKNPKYEQALKYQCAEGDRIISRMLKFGYLKNRITNTAFEKANVVYEDFGTLNVTKSQAKTLQKMVDKRVQQLRKAQIKEILDAENLFSINK